MSVNNGRRMRSNFMTSLLSALGSISGFNPSELADLLWNIISGLLISVKLFSSFSSVSIGETSQRVERGFVDWSHCLNLTLICTHAGNNSDGPRTGCYSPFPRIGQGILGDPQNRFLIGSKLGKFRSFPIIWHVSNLPKSKYLALFPLSGCYRLENTTMRLVLSRTKSFNLYLCLLSPSSSSSMQRSLHAPQNLDCQVTDRLIPLSTLDSIR